MPSNDFGIQLRDIARDSFGGNLAATSRNQVLRSLHMDQEDGEAFVAKLNGGTRIMRSKEPIVLA
jgi:hypothetical protein